MIIMLIHICNECKYKDICKDKFKEPSGMLCKNKHFQIEREIEWGKENGK